MVRLIVEKGRVPIKIWTDKIEDGALKQAVNLSNLPFIFSHVAIMPDVHEGFGMPIGAVVALENVIIPHAVGVDIGCGMHAVKTYLKGLSKSEIIAISNIIKNTIPLGFDKYSTKQDTNMMPRRKVNLPKHFISYKEYDNALYSLGTLGGGNHFIEIQSGDDGYIWFMIHSGSRNLGKRVADHYNMIAKKLNEKWSYPVPASFELFYLPVDMMEGKDYLEEMNFCIDYAKSNRRLISERVESIIQSVTGKRDIVLSEYDIIHNYATLERHFGKKVWIHRKGATRALKEEMGVIPGSQGTSSYIVKGLGNPESFNSCSHGAGRVLSRHKARKNLSLDKEIKRLEKLGIIHSIRSRKDLDEAPSAYKNIDEVVNNQLDLIKPIVKLFPLAVIKG